MINKKVIVIGAVLLLIPTLTMGISAAQEEEADIIQIGSWQAQRFTNLVFVPEIGGFNTTSKTVDFYINDQAGGIKGIIPGLIMQKGVLVVYENDSANATQLTPDEAGIYTLELPQTGNYTILVLTQPMINIPIIGKFLFPGSSNTIAIHRGYAVPWTIIIGGVFILIFLIVMLCIIRNARKRKLKEK